MSPSVVHRKAKNDLGLPGKSEKNRVEFTHGVSIERVLHHLHHDVRMSVNRMSDALDVSRRTLDRWFGDAGIHKRGRSEAERVKWGQMSEEERRQQVQAAHEKTRQQLENGEHHVQKMWEENPEEMMEHVQSIAHLGAPARNENGMKGVTGQDHPNWRGGKSIYDAVKKQLRPSFETVKDQYREEICASCGTSAEELGRGLDVHHIVPLLCGGTNERWNALTLCPSCHHKAEWYMRDILSPILVE